MAVRLATAWRARKHAHAETLAKAPNRNCGSDLSRDGRVQARSHILTPPSQFPAPQSLLRHRAKIFLAAGMGRAVQQAYSAMMHFLPHQHGPQAGTSITKAGQQMGCAPMSQCASQWLKPTTRPGCLS